MAKAKVDHTASDEQTAFLQKTPKQQNLEIWLRAGETNGAIAAAIESIAALDKTIAQHDSRLSKLESWQIKAAAIIAAAIIAAPGFFYLLAQVWHTKG